LEENDCPNVLIQRLKYQVILKCFICLPNCTESYLRTP